MKTFGRIVFFVATVVVSLLALLLLFPGMKEGFSRSELPFLAGGIAVVVLLAVVWWRASRGARGWAIAAWCVLAVPGLAGLSTAVSLISAYIEGERLARNVRIEAYSEAPIHWPGFDGPVGLTVTFDLVHPEGVSALILPPEIRMGPVLDIPRGAMSSTQTSGGGYFKDTYLDAPVGDLTLLKTALFQRLYENRQAEQEYQKWTSTYRFEDGGRTALAFRLHPGTLDYLAGPERLCLSMISHGIRRCTEGEKPAEVGCSSRYQRPVETPIYHLDDSLTALWMAAGASDMTADLSPLLTRTLRAESRLQGDPVAWTAMQKRLEPDGLRKAGYRLCPPGEDSHTAFRSCFCRDGGE